MISLSKPSIKKEDIDAVVSVLQSGMLVQGKEVEDLEGIARLFLQAQHCACVANGTATLHLALLVSGIGPGDEVIVPAFSYIATANVVELVGAKPVFVDIDIETYNINVSKIEEVITQKTKAIIPVHEFGLACDIESIMQISKKHNLVVIEDAACALGAKYKDKFAGTFGDFGSFSLHPRKAITSGEGGILVSGDSDKMEKIRILRNHGISLASGKMDFVAPGYNYRMTDFQAALVKGQFKRINEIISRRQKLAELYKVNITNSKIKLPFVPDYTEHTWQTFHLLLDKKLKRDAIITKLKECNIGSNYGAQCIPAMTYYQRKYNYNCADFFPNALLAYEQGLAIPMHDSLSEEEIMYVSIELNKL